MRRSRTIVLVLVLTACAVAATRAQQAFEPHPNFSGLWHLVEDRSVARQEGAPVTVNVWGDALRVRHARGRLIIALDSEKPIARSYRLDGQPSVNRLPAPGGRRETVAMVAWQGDQLVITEREKHEDDGAAETVRRLTMNADGTMTVEAPWGDDGAFVASVYARSR